MDNKTNSILDIIDNVKLPYANGNAPRTEEEKERIIEDAAYHYGNYMTALGFDWQTDPNSADTPRRVAKAFVNDLAEGCFNEPPNITTFDNVDQYDGLVFQGNIKVNSFCSHHHLPFIGKAHVSYIPGKDGQVIGLSKIYLSTNIGRLLVIDIVTGKTRA